MVEIIIALVLGSYLGYSYRDLRDNIDDIWGRISGLEDAQATKKSGVTMGSYHHIDEVNPPRPTPKATGHVVNPKTPQKMEWDAAQELQKANEKFRVGPK